MFVAWSGLLSWVQITDVGRSLYIVSFCPAITSLNRYLEESAFSILISSSVFIFLWLFSRCIMDMMSSHDKMTQYTNFSPHQWFEIQDQQSRPSNKQKSKLKKNNYNNQWFQLQLSTAQAKRQKWLQHPKDLLLMLLLTTKGLQDRNINILDGTMVENKGK